MSEKGSTSFACGTAEQAIEKLRELIARGFQDVTVTDPNGRKWTADEFQRITGDEQP
ncbi:hypothetical protein JNW90_28570 [Micromonospora sp. STR1s_5]|nr:hypothetical protein [Micromonospora sp. STR1s_5]